MSLLREGSLKPVGDRPDHEVPIVPVRDATCGGVPALGGDSEEDIDRPGDVPRVARRAENAGFQFPSEDLAEKREIGGDHAAS